MPTRCWPDAHSDGRLPIWRHVYIVKAASEEQPNSDVVTRRVSVVVEVTITFQKDYFSKVSGSHLLSLRLAHKGIEHYISIGRTTSPLAFLMASRWISQRSVAWLEKKITFGVIHLKYAGPYCATCKKALLHSIAWFLTICRLYITHPYRRNLRRKGLKEPPLLCKCLQATTIFSY